MRQDHSSTMRAVTLIEMITVILIIGTLASLAIPRLFGMIEKSRIGEAINILDALRNAQEIYKQEKGVYTQVLDDLDLTISQPQNFAMPTVATANPIASIQRNVTGYNYTLTIDNSGAVKCTGTNPANICARLGCSGGSGGDQCN